MIPEFILSLLLSLSGHLLLSYCWTILKVLLASQSRYVVFNVRECGGGSHWPIAWPSFVYNLVNFPLQVSFIGMSCVESHIVRLFCLHWPEDNLLTNLSTEKQPSLLSEVGYNQINQDLMYIYMHTLADNIN